ncbi:MAG TPA: PKD domain-containing protein [Cyclobacteriaceae bacterium]|nr:PKD domain-containing protein [Cyclobacteriaceae bacterium]
MRLALLLLLITFNVIGQDIDGLHFIQNKGQWNDGIDFQAQVPGGRVGVSARGFSVLLLDMEEMERHHLAGHEPINESTGQPSSEPVNGHYFQINLLGSNQQAKAIVESPLEGHYNYFLGNDTCRWATNALAFASVLYQDVYNGIDFRVSSVGNNLKYDFIVKPGADPSQIKIEYAGVDGIEMSDEELEIRTIVGSLTELRPYSYQLDCNNKQSVPSQYRIRNNIVSFSFPADYDKSRTLVIDPLLIFSTYSGSTADNWGSTATPGEHGTLYSAGVTNQLLGGFFPATPGSFQTTNHGNFDMAVIKYDSAGTKFLYATHLGGVNNDSPESLVVDKTSGDLIVLGISSSPDYPTSVNAFDKTFNFGTTIFNRVFDTEDQWDIVVTRLSPNGGQLIGSTFLGGSGNDGLNIPKQSGGPLVVNYGDEMRGDVITDETGHVYISSVTASNDFPIVNGFDDSFNGGTTDGLVVKLAPDLSSIVWSGYVGGSGFDAAYSIKFDNDDNLVLAGGTTSADFPVTAGSYQTVFNGIVDGWIARVAADGSAVMNATFTGTASFDQVYFIDLNADGDVFCYGQTAGQMPVTSGVYRNANSGQFLQRFSPDLSTLKFATVFGSGSTNGLTIPNISPTAFLVNDCDNIYMAGWGGFVNSNPSTGFWQSTTNGMPVTEDAYQKTTSGSDFYFIVLNGDATELVYSTYLGGNSSKTHVDGGTSRFDKYGIVYHAVCSGCQFGNESGGSTSDFPTTPNAKSRLNASPNCNNAAFKFDLSSLRAMFDTNNLALTAPGFNNVCYPDSIVFQNISTGGKTITWDFDDGTVVVQEDTDPRLLIHQYQQAGQYHVKLKITDLSTCSQTDSVVKVINYFKPKIIVSADATICEGNSFQLSASGGISYHWVSEDGTFSSSQQYPTVKPDTATSYFVTVIDADGCSKKDTLNLAVTQNVHASFQTYDLNFSKPGYNNVCFPELMRFKNLSVNGETFVWDYGDGTTFDQTKSDTVSAIHLFPHQGVYNVKLKAINLNTCNKADSVIKKINYFEDNIQIGPDGEICEGRTFPLTASGGSVYAWSTADNSFNSSSPSPVVQPEHTTQYFVTVTDAHECVRKDTIQVTVLDSVDLKWEHRFNGNCTDRPTVFVQNLSPAADDVIFHFDFGDGSTSEETELEHLYEKDGTYSLKFSAQKKFCIYEETVQLPVYGLFVPNVFTPEDSPGYNDTFEIGFGPDKIAPATVGLTVQLSVFDRWGKKVFESPDYKNDWNGHGVVGGVYYINLKVGEVATCKSWLHIMK